jgi:hypothetical protein
LHPAQDEAEQPLQPEPDDDEDEVFELFPIPNCDRRLVVSFDPQVGQSTSGFAPKTSFSKPPWHWLH